MAVTPQGFKIPVLKRHKYHATFLHDYEDFHDIEPLVQLLEDRGIKCALPGTREVRAGHFEIENLEYCLKSSKCSVICISPNFVRHRYHRTDWNLALWRHKTTKTKHRIVPLILKKSYIPDCLSSFGPIQLSYQKNVIIGILNRILGKPPDNRFTAKFLKKKCMQLARSTAILKYRKAQLPHVQYDTIELQAINAELNLRVECPNPNCSHMCYRRDLPMHVAVCQYTTLRCKYKPCDFKGVRKVMTKHVLECSHAEVPCPNSGCTHKVKRHLFERHGDLCEHGLVKCANCKLKIKKHKLNSHKKECQYVLCQNPGCKEILSLHEKRGHMEKCKFRLVLCPVKECKHECYRWELEDHLNICPHYQIKCLCGELVYRDDFSLHQLTCRSQKTTQNGYTTQNTSKLSENKKGNTNLQETATALVANGSFCDSKSPFKTSNKATHVFTTALDESGKSWWSNLKQRLRRNESLAPLQVAASPFNLDFLVKTLYQNQLLTAYCCEKILNAAKKIRKANPYTTINAAVYKALHNYDTRFSKIISDNCEKFKDHAKKEFEFSQEIMTTIKTVGCRDYGNNSNESAAPVSFLQRRGQQKLSDKAIAVLFLKM